MSKTSFLRQKFKINICLKFVKHKIMFEPFNRLIDIQKLPVFTICNYKVNFFLIANIFEKRSSISISAFFFFAPDQLRLSKSRHLKDHAYLSSLSLS
jgi:hypothetical protein